MNLQELKAYVLANRHDNRAWDEFVSRPRPNATIVPANTSPEEVGRILERALSNKESE